MPLTLDIFIFSELDKREWKSVGKTNIRRHLLVKQEAQINLSP